MKLHTQMTRGILALGMFAGVAGWAAMHPTTPDGRGHDTGRRAVVSVSRTAAAAPGVSRDDHVAVVVHVPHARRAQLSAAAREVDFD